MFGRTIAIPLAAIAMMGQASGTIAPFHAPPSGATPAPGVARYEPGMSRYEPGMARYDIVSSIVATRAASAVSARHGLTRSIAPGSSDFTSAVRNPETGHLATSRNATDRSVIAWATTGVNAVGRNAASSTSNAQTASGQLDSVQRATGLASNRAALGLPIAVAVPCTPSTGVRIACATDENASALANRGPGLFVLLAAIAAIGLGIAAASGGSSSPTSP